MRRTYVALAYLCWCVTPSVVPAEEKRHTQMDMQAVMEIYEQLANPGEPHKQLASMAGSWNTKTKEWMEPGRPPMESEGACEHKMVLGGRFLQQECTGTMMGKTFTGIGMIGYDNHARKYISTWMDSM